MRAEQVRQPCIFETAGEHLAHRVRCVETLDELLTFAFGRVERFGALLKEFERDLLSLAGKNLGAIKRAYSEGLVPISQVIQAQRQVLELEVAYLDILPKYILALIDLETVTATSPFLKRDYLASTTELIANLENAN